MRYILSLDQGTTSSRALLFDEYQQVVAVVQYPIRQYYPNDGWVEHDGLEIWETTRRAALAVLEKASVSVAQLVGVGITNQRETTLLWDRRTGQPLAPAIVWQDRRTAQLCENIRQDGMAETIRQKTGLVIDAYFSATKLQWLLQQIPEAQERAEKGELCFGTVDTWLLWNLTGGQLHLTDVSNASRTLFFNLHTLTWDEELLAYFKIPAALLPQVVDCSSILGHTAPSLFGMSIPIGGMAGDQQAALFGQGCTQAGTAKNTYGTGCFLLMNVGDKPVATYSGLLSTVAWRYNGKTSYALEGAVFIAGAAIQWLRDGLQLIESSAETETLALQAEDNGGLYFVPAFTGLGAPHWDMYARGMLIGITRASTKAQVVRATLESIAFQNLDVIALMVQEASLPLTRLRVDGGATQNRFLLQFQADILGVPVERPAMLERTALGAARFAGLSLGFWNDRDFADHSLGAEVFYPTMPASERERLQERWRQAVERAKGWMQ